MRRREVLIVGGGPVGLALACELGWRGIACTLVEQGDGRIDTPKMNEVSIRTMEFCQRWGIADKVHNCPFPADYPLDVSFVTSLSGYELGRLRRPSRAKAQPGPHSPMLPKRHCADCSQGRSLNLCLSVDSWKCCCADKSSCSRKTWPKSRCVDKKPPKSASPTRRFWR